jgi:sialate O-acetylesterase
MSFRFIISLFLAALTTQASAEVSLPSVFTSRMVLQRDIPIPVWGNAAPNEKITVSIGNQSKTTTADADGKWQIKLAPLSTGEPATLTVAGSNVITLNDVLIGEVWVGSGQSNIDTPVNAYAEKDQPLREAAGKNHPQLRLYRSAKASNGWQSATPDTLRGFSAQLFYFGMKLQQELNVPVGLVEAAVQGSPSVYWISDEAFHANPQIKSIIADYEKNRAAADRQRFQDAMANWKKNVVTAIASDPAFSGDNAEKPSQELLKKFPYPWQPPAAGFSKSKKGEHYEHHIQPLIPFAIRGVLWDQGEGGTDAGQIPQDVLMRALIGFWRQQWNQGDFPWIYVQKPSGQGCALDPNNPVNLGAKPFGNLPEKPESNSGGRFEYIRIMQQNPNTYMTFTSDLVPDVHPPNKSGYATRDSLVALGAVYGKPVEYYGPVFKSMKIEGDKLRITFDHTGKGLTAPANQQLQGFAIAGADKNFHWANAAIDGDSVILSSPAVANPEAATYAYGWYIAWANLFNQDGLPALTFRTDANW